MKLTFPSVVSLDLFYSISSESPGGGAIKSVWKKCRPLGRQSFCSECWDQEGFWADLREPVSVFVPFLLLWPSTRQETRGRAYLGSHLRVQSILAGRRGGKEAPCHGIWAQVHPTFQGARKQRKGKTMLSWIVPLSLSLPRLGLHPHSRQALPLCIVFSGRDTSNCMLH